MTSAPKVGQQARAVGSRVVGANVENPHSVEEGPHVGVVNAHLVPAAWLAIGLGQDLGGVLANSRRRTPHCSGGPRKLRRRGDLGYRTQRRIADFDDHFVMDRLRFSEDLTLV